MKSPVKVVPPKPLGNSDLDESKCSSICQHEISGLLYWQCPSYMGTVQVGTAWLNNPRRQKSWYLWCFTATCSVSYSCIWKLKEFSKSANFPSGPSCSWTREVFLCASAVITCLTDFGMGCNKVSKTIGDRFWSRTKIYSKQQLGLFRKHHVPWKTGKGSPQPYILLSRYL